MPIVHGITIDSKAKTIAYTRADKAIGPPPTYLKLETRRVDLYRFNTVQDGITGALISFQFYTWVPSGASLTTIPFSQIEHIYLDGEVLYDSQTGLFNSFLISRL
jgi:hypothetical protein